MNLSNHGQSKVYAQGGFAEGENEIKKYLRIFRRRKWLILATLLIVSLGWVIYVILYDSQPVYSSSALLHFQNPKEMSAVESGGKTFNTSRMTFLETNSLLGQVIEELQLNFSILTENIGKNDLFDYIYVTAASVPGEYKMVKSGDQFKLYYTNEEDGVKNRLLLSFNARDTIRINNFALSLNDEFASVQSKKDFKFLIRNYDVEIKSLRERISYSWLDRKSLTNLSISVSSRFPRMAAKIANTLAEKFVEFDSQINNRKNDEVLKILEEQLIVAKQDLDDINQKIQRFKERNPMVTDANPVVAITNLEQSRNTIQTKIQEINNLILQYRNAPTFEDQLDNSRQLLTYLLASEGIPSATVFEEELATLTTERNSYFGQYAPSHSVFKQNEAKFGTLFKKVENVALEHVSKLEGTVANLDRNIAAERGNLAKLPYKQRQLSELVIDQGVKQKVYEVVLTRYNRAKIDSEVEVGDVFILDRAQVPPEQGRLSLILSKSLLGIVLGLALGIGLAIVREFFDKTVQTPEDLESRVKLPVIGSIPVIHSHGEDKVPDNIRDQKGKRDTKLITLDYSPTLESESYRDIRTKLLFMNENQKLSSFLITSLRPGEGKSLTASNLAVTFAQQKISTLLIDGDLRRGVLHNVYANKKKPGLGDFLISKATVDYQNLSRLIQKTIIPNLYLVTAGSPLPNPTEMLGSERMMNVMSVFKSRFGMVILDTAPFQAGSDVAILSSVVGGILIVVQAEHTNIELLNRKLQEYRKIQDKILGLVLNMVKVDAQKERYQYSYYNY